MDTATTPKSSLIGRAIGGRFRVTGFIGEGAMATVYRGIQDGEPRDVAVKVMHPHLVGDPSFVKRFRREAKAAAVLKHPNTVQIVDYGIDSELPYIVMELVSGQDLFELLVVEKMLDPSLAVRILIQVCDALSAAHDLGIVHRDLKPENVMLLRDPEDPIMERVKVLDFGIAKIVDRNDKDSGDEPPTSIGDSILTTVGVIVGTPQYMSPEQCRAGPIDARSDVYACGILLYQLVTGKLPFSGEHPFEIAMKQVREMPPLPTSIVPTLHPELEKLILKALEKWPAQRHQSARELRNDLARVLRFLPDDRQARVSWPTPTPGTAYGRRSIMADLPNSTGEPRHPSQPSTMRSANVPHSELGDGDRREVNIAMVGFREPITTTLTSGEAVTDEPPPPRQSTPGRSSGSGYGASSAPSLSVSSGKASGATSGTPAGSGGLRANHPGSTTLATGERPALFPVQKPPPQPPPQQGGLTWLLLPMAIGLGIGVGILAYLAILFMRQ